MPALSGCTSKCGKALCSPTPLFGVCSKFNSPRGDFSYVSAGSAPVFSPQGLCYMQPRLHISARCFETRSVFQQRCLCALTSHVCPAFCLSVLTSPSFCREAARSPCGAALWSKTGPCLQSCLRSWEGSVAAFGNTCPHVAKTNIATCVAGVGILSFCREFSSLGWLFSAFLFAPISSSFHSRVVKIAYGI